MVADSKLLLDHHIALLCDVSSPELLGVDLDATTRMNLLWGVRCESGSPCEMVVVGGSSPSFGMASIFYKYFQSETGCYTNTYRVTVRRSAQYCFRLDSSIISFWRLAMIETKYTGFRSLRSS